MVLSGDWTTAITISLGGGVGYLGIYLADIVVDERSPFGGVVCCVVMVHTYAPLRVLATTCLYVHQGGSSSATRDEATVYHSRYDRNELAAKCSST